MVSILPLQITLKVAPTLKTVLFPAASIVEQFHVPPQGMSVFERASVQQGADVHSLEPVAVENVCGAVDHDHVARPLAGLS